MSTFRHGLLIGKFYPPHAGHHRVIREAAAQCERVSVIAMASAAETIPLQDRVSWLSAEHAGEPAVRVAGIRCDAPVDLSDQQVWAAQVAAIRRALDTITSEAVDAVYSAEVYGEELARWFDAKSVPVRRSKDDASGTAIRHDLAGRWRQLAAGTRAGLATRIVLVGAESTGTTSISQALVRHYRRQGEAWAATGWVAEYGREYTETAWQLAQAAARAADQPVPQLAELTWTHEDFDRSPRRKRSARSWRRAPVHRC